MTNRDKKGTIGQPSNIEMLNGKQRTHFLMFFADMGQARPCGYLFWCGTLIFGPQLVRTPTDEKMEMNECGKMKRKKNNEELNITKSLCICLAGRNSKLRVVRGRAWVSKPCQLEISNPRPRVLGKTYFCSTRTTLRLSHYPHPRPSSPTKNVGSMATEFVHCSCWNSLSLPPSSSFEDQRLDLEIICVDNDESRRSSWTTLH